MDDMVQPGGPPGPRRQHLLIKALGEDAPATQDGVAMKSAYQNHEANRLARHRQE